MSKNNRKTTEQMIEELALSVGRGFAEAKGDLQSLRQEVRDGFAAVDRRFADTEKRLDRIEFNTSGLERRISIVEDRVVQLARKTGLEFN